MEQIVMLPLDEVLQLTPYETANIFPMLIDEAEPPSGYEGLTLPQFADQILKEGIREPLVIWNGFLLDGRNRRAAAEKAASLKPADLAGLDFEPVDLTNIPVRYAEFQTKEDADSWVLSLNIDRRSMNKDQLACLAVKFWEIESQRAEERKKATQFGSDQAILPGPEGQTKSILARRFHVSEGYIQKARTLWLSDRVKFDRAASGKERVLGKLVSPGQKIKPETDQNELALVQINDAFNKMKTAIGVLGKSNGDTYASAKNNVQNKIIKLQEIFNEEFTT